MSRACRVCGNVAGNRDLVAHEMMFGTREAFAYVECAACGCVQIADPPADYAPYYPPGYFSFRPRARLAANRLRRLVDRRRVADRLHGFDPIGRAANRVSRPLDYVEWMRAARVGLDARVLDVGCGGGKLLVRMAHGGFTHLTGLDPFLDAPIHYPNGVEVLVRDVEAHAAERPAGYDLVMFHHSFEHLPEPFAAMAAARALLAPGGCVLVRVPVADSLAFERYRECWVQLDAPRHLFLHTRASLARVASHAGLEVERVVHDSTAGQFTGSELYVRGIPLSAPRRERAIFDAATLARFAEEAERLNREGRGDQASFYLRAG